MSRKVGDHWISFSDIMTGLMVIFMFIAISYMMEVNKKQQAIEQVLDSYENTKDTLRLELQELIDKNLEEWKEYIEFDTSNLSIKFVGQEIQFTGNSDVIRPRFKDILDDFIPQYLDVITQEKYRDKIAEIRIEGHANKAKLNSYDTQDYMLGVFWSQRRAKRVLEYVVASRDFQSLAEPTRIRLEFWLVANGYGYGRTLDESGNYSIQSDEEICEECSRRVEFRIITTSEQVIADIIERLKKQ